MYQRTTYDDCQASLNNCCSKTHPCNQRGNGGRGQNEEIRGGRDQYEKGELVAYVRSE